MTNNEPNRNILTPCIKCDKAIVFLWPEEDNNNLSSATDFNIKPQYGSDFDLNVYKAMICDSCLNKLIQNKQVTFIRRNYV